MYRSVRSSLDDNSCRFFNIVRWLRVIFRPGVYRVEESMKFGTTNLFGVRNKFSLGATCFDGRGGGEDTSFQFLITLISMKRGCKISDYFYNAFD